MYIKQKILDIGADENIGSDWEIRECYYKKNIESNTRFKLAGNDYMIVKPHKKYARVEIDYECDDEIKQLPQKDKDYILLQIDDEDNEVIYSYIRINKFTDKTNYFSQCSKEEILIK